MGLLFASMLLAQVEQCRARRELKENVSYFGDIGVVAPQNCENYWCASISLLSMACQV